MTLPSYIQAYHNGKMLKFASRNLKLCVLTLLLDVTPEVIHVTFESLVFLTWLLDNFDRYEKSYQAIADLGPLDEQQY